MFKVQQKHIGEKMSCLRCRVHPIEMHLDPTAIVSDDGNIVVAYGVSTGDLLRIKNALPNLNKLGLLMLKKLNGNYGFLVFDKMIVCMHPGFQLALNQIGLVCASDFSLSDFTEAEDLEQFSKWITLEGKIRAEARNTAHRARMDLTRTRLGRLLGSYAWEIIGDLAWATASFEPLHALTLLAKSSTPINLNIYSLQETLRKHNADLRFLGGNSWILARKKKRVTLMDVARYIFPPNHYFEVKEDNLARVLGMPKSKVSSHLRGYIVVDDAYVKRIYDERIECR